MKMRKVVAPNMKEAMEKVKSEMGSDAVILHSKQTQTKYFFNLLKKPKVEVIAALDQEPVYTKQQK